MSSVALSRLRRDGFGAHVACALLLVAFVNPVCAQIWEGRGAMIRAQQDAQRVARSAWPEHIADPKAADLLDGFAWYAATRDVEHAFDLSYLRLAHSVESRPYFGGHVIWSFPTLRLSRHAAASRNPYAAAFDSLERWMGTPTLQAAMYEVTQLPVDRLTASEIITTLSDAAGQDLSWAFASATTNVDYVVDSIADKSVTVSRRGDAQLPPGAVALKVVFGDGSGTVAAWDGPDQSRTFQFQSSSPIVAAYLDPDRIVAVDRNHLDNSIVTAAPTNVPVAKWAARWMVWLQHTMLSYGFLA